MKQLKITKFPALDYAGNEAFNTLSTNLSFAGENIKKIMLTSCHASEGKSYLSMNLSRTLAQRGKRVALVDADLRRSMINSVYGVRFEYDKSSGNGLSHFLAGMVGMDEVIYQTDITNMLMVPVGREVQIEQSGCPILGTVLNQVDYDNYLSRKYYYSKYSKYRGKYYGRYYTPTHTVDKK